MLPQTELMPGCNLSQHLCALTKVVESETMPMGTLRGRVTGSNRSPPQVKAQEAQRGAQRAPDAVVQSADPVTSPYDG